ncbi:hypothetical protein Sfr7A_01120 [Streptomyces xinghaiensis]|uniref:Uncharacterized protein n=1 Tax=Streptomyces xinghaiensis TaxID=1038928 RepID=A0A3R7HNU2_9ACTN|nr:hypothetical protein Sfr7A_01120 [Streptomyces xinghaiensis]RKM99455.1 hypothetical protein SFRA_001120 [Streptomyces xinghaiensis]RNC76481.1 hypothetical protein DC095_003255 [Streptomyces xinghaiensis]
MPYRCDHHLSAPPGPPPPARRVPRAAPAGVGRTRGAGQKKGRHRAGRKNPPRAAAAAPVM